MSWEASISMSKTEQQYGDLPCFNCGRLVRVSIPFSGCIFCGDCMESQNYYQSANTEDFKRGIAPEPEEPK